MTLQKSLAIIILFILFLCSCKSQKQVSYRNEECLEEELMQYIVNNIEESSETKTLLDKAKEWLGTPYKYGHSEKGSGTDCSGMVMVLYSEVYNVKLPRNSAKQADYCSQVSNSDVLPGDLVFFATGKNRTKVSHVGIMINKTQFIHASSSKGVIISDMSTNYYKQRFIKFGRVPILID